MKADPVLIQKWQQNPNDRVAVIIHVRGNPRRRAEAVREAGLTVSRTFRLTNTIAASGPAHGVLSLLDTPWVDRIEPDRTITTA